MFLNEASNCFDCVPALLKCKVGHLLLNLLIVVKSGGLLFTFTLTSTFCLSLWSFFFKIVIRFTINDSNYDAHCIVINRKKYNDNRSIPRIAIAKRALNFAFNNKNNCLKKTWMVANDGRLHRKTKSGSSRKKPYTNYLIYI